MLEKKGTPVIAITLTQDESPHLNVKHWHTDTQPETEGENEERFCGGLCCLSGCLCAAVGAAYFFILIPTSIFLLISGSNNGSELALGLGIGLLLLCLVITPLLYFLWRYCRRKCISRHDRRDLYHNSGFDNPQNVMDKS